MRTNVCKFVIAIVALSAFCSIRTEASVLLKSSVLVTDGQINGDLLVLIQEEAHPELTREGSDLIYNLLLSVPDAILGSAVEIPTVEGKVKVKIEGGTQPGKILRLKGKGLPEVNSYHRGDLLVRINVFIPKDLPKEDARLVEKLKESEAFLAQEGAGQTFFSRMKNMFE